MAPLPDPALLTLYLEVDQDLRALADRTGRTLLDLLDWFADPTVQQALAHWDQAAARADEAQARADRRLALDTLRSTIASSEDAVERRRAASAILRALSPRRPPPNLQPDLRPNHHRPHYHSNPRPHSAPSTQHSALPTPTVAAVMREYHASMAQAGAEHAAAQRGFAQLQALAHPSTPRTNTPVPASPAIAIPAPTSPDFDPPDFDPRHAMPAISHHSGALPRGP